MGKDQIIELNGQRYDALTGKLLSRNQAKTPNHSSPAGTAKKASNIDGFTRSRASKTSVKSIPRRVAQKSKTLMRSGVSKPVSPEVKAPTKVEVNQPKFSTPPARSQRAKTVKQNHLVKHFGTLSDVQASLKAAVPASISAPASAMVSALPKPFSLALSKAETHKQPTLKKQTWLHKTAKRLKSRSKLVNAGAVILIVIAVGGYFTYQNLPNLSMRLASARSSVAGSIPSYQPSGFNLAKHIEFKPGQIVINYRSNSDERTYQITQTASAWNSDTLKENYLADKQSIQSVQDKGKTIYLYNGNSATWVDGKVWYKIDGTNSQLSSDQLLKVADSL